MLTQHWKNTISQALNRICPLCHMSIPVDSNDYWCPYCLSLFAPKPRCQRCGLPLHTETEICGQCLLYPPLWDHLTCIADYAFPLNQYLYQIKHRRQFELIAPLAGLLSQRLNTESPPELITYVPLHWKRWLFRGFNQSEILAHYLARDLNSPVKSLFRKHRYTKPQQQLNRSQRLSNLNHSFLLKEKPHQKHIAIVDDVVTTGATLSILCEKLLELGVETIDIYCICRTPEPD